MRQSASMAFSDNSEKTYQYRGIILPEIKQWKLCVKKQHGDSNRFNVISAFYDFIISPELKEFPMPGICFISGNVYGHKLVSDGEEIATSYIRKLFVPDQGCVTMEPEIGQLIGLETSNNSLYYILYQDEFPFTVL